MEPRILDARVVRFATFEVDLRSGEVRKGGVKLKLSGQPFQVLAILLERPGEVVTREELQKRLWPDTFVDVDHNLNTAINKIREVLGDEAENPRFVETLPRRGYRFIGPTEGKAARVEGIAKTRSRFRVVGAGLAGVALLGVAVLLFYLRPGSRLEVIPLVPLPFTSYVGTETAPAISRDGSRIAFAWNNNAATQSGGFDLYVKAVGSETLLRLTHHPSEWIAPEWSPDGTQIAFHRLDGADTGIYVVPALGGPERKLRSTHVPYNVAAQISWSPDGQWIGFTETPVTGDGDRAFLLSLGNLEARQLPHIPGCAHEATPVFSHSGVELAYVCVRSMSEFALYSMVLPNGTPKVITSFPNGTSGFAWATDDRSLLLSQTSGPEPELYEVPLPNGAPRKLPLPSNAGWPTISGHKLAYSNISNNINIWRKDVLHPQLPPVELLSSTRQQNQAEYSPDGKHIAFHSNRSGAWTLWMSDADGANVVQIANLEVSPGNPHWAPDSSHIVFASDHLGHTETYVVEVSERVPRRVVTRIREMSTPSWSHDGKWIYFRSREGLEYKLYRCSPDGGTATLIPADPEVTGPLESSDGSAIYFAPRLVKAQLKKRS